MGVMVVVGTVTCVAILVLQKLGALQIGTTNS